MHSVSDIYGEMLGISRTYIASTQVGTAITEIFAGTSDEILQGGYD